MSRTFTTREIKSPGKPGEAGKFYAVPAPATTVKLRGVAEEIAARTSLSSTDVIATLDALMNVIPDLLSQGNNINLGDFGSFRLYFSSTGSEKEEQVTAANIQSVRLAFRSGKELKKQIKEIKFVKEKKKKDKGK
jgi:predicted histone-like DNA-binding protein